jgi:hypothetical protein
MLAEQVKDSVDVKRLTQLLGKSQENVGVWNWELEVCAEMLGPGD